MQKKKKQVAERGWARDAQEEEGGAGGGPARAGGVLPSLQLVGTEGFRWTPPDLGCRYAHLPALRQAPCCKQELAPSPSSWLTQLPSKPKQVLRSSTLWLFSLVYFVAALRGMWDLSSPAGDRTCAPCIGNLES